MRCSWRNADLKDSQLLTGTVGGERGSVTCPGLEERNTPCRQVPGHAPQDEGGETLGRGGTQRACCPQQSNNEPGTSVLKQKRDSTEERRKVRRVKNSKYSK